MRLAFRDVARAPLFLFAWTLLCACPVPAQDLVVSSISIGPLRLTGGTSQVMHVSTRNVGTRASSPSVSVIVLSRDAIITSDDLLIGVVPVRSLMANDTHSAQQSFFIPNCMGDWSPCWIGAIADVGNAVAETNENNNTASQRLLGCRFGATPGQIHYRTKWGTPALSATTATFATRTGGRAGLCVIGRNTDLYICVWSLSRNTFAFDAASSFSLALANTPMFAAWVGSTDGNGLASPVLAVPALRPPLARALTVHTHVVFLDRRTAVLRTFSANSVAVTLL